MHRALGLIAPWLALFALACGDGSDATDAGESIDVDHAPDARVVDAGAVDARATDDLGFTDAESADAIRAMDAELADVPLPMDAEPTDSMPEGNDAEPITDATPQGNDAEPSLDAAIADAAPNPDAAPSPDAEVVHDAGDTVDAEVIADAASSPDATAPDATEVALDAEAFADAEVDAGFLDASAPDAAPEDAGFFDAAAPDAEALDATAPDLGFADAATFPDAAAPDAFVPVNTPPTVGAIIGVTTAISGDSRTFSVTVLDADGDPLVVAWSDGTGGTTNFPNGTSAASTTWMAPVVGSAGTYTLQVSVSDGHNAAVTRTVNVSVAVPTFTNVQTIFDTVPCTGCHGGSGGLFLDAASSYNDLVSVSANACLMNRVEPFDPDNSAIVHKMQGTACGSRMPRSDPTYFDTHPGLIRRMRAWILSGAPNN